MKVWIDKNNLQKLKTTRFTFTIQITLLEPSEVFKNKYVEFSSFDEEIKIEENREIKKLKIENERYKEVIKRFYRKFKHLMEK